MLPTRLWVRPGQGSELSTGSAPGSGLPLAAVSWDSSEPCEERVLLQSVEPAPALPVSRARRCWWGCGQTTKPRQHSLLLSDWEWLWPADLVTPACLSDCAHQGGQCLLPGLRGQTGKGWRGGGGSALSSRDQKTTLLGRGDSRSHEQTQTGESWKAGVREAGTMRGGPGGPGLRRAGAVEGIVGRLRSKSIWRTWESSSSSEADMPLRVCSLRGTGAVPVCVVVGGGLWG